MSLIGTKTVDIVYRSRYQQGIASEKIFFAGAARN